MRYSVEELKTIISPIASAHKVDRVSVFGSYSKGTANDASDVDLLVSKGEMQTLFQLCGFRLALEDALNIPVDIVTETSMDQDFLNGIRKDRVVLYQRA